MKNSLKAISVAVAILLMCVSLAACDSTSGNPQSETPTNSITSKETTGQKNATAKAKEYLSILAFSRDGLVEQLKFEQFTDEEAEYGADNCGADWNEQAVKKAKEYLDITAFSKDGLIEQLVFDKFTEEQATHGVEDAFK